MNAGTEAHAVAEAAKKVARSPLALMVGVSLLIHLLLSAVISIENPPSTPQFPDDARIALITPGNSEPEIVEWITANDPANVFGPEMEQPEVMQLRYEPSYEATVPAIKAASPGESEISIPDLRQPGTNLGSRAGGMPPLPAAPPVARLESKLTPAPVLEELRGAMPSKEQLGQVRSAAHYFVLNEPGMPGAVVLLGRGSGCENLDELGRKALAVQGQAGPQRLFLTNGKEKIE